MMTAHSAAGPNTWADDATKARGQLVGAKPVKEEEGLWEITYVNAPCLFI